MSDQLKYDIFSTDGKLGIHNYQALYQLDPITGEFKNYQLLSNINDKIDDDKSSITKIPKHLIQSKFQDIFIIDSIYSGIGRDNRDFYKDILKPIFKDLNINHNYIKTENDQSIINFIKDQIVKNSTIILLSGDSSIFEIVNTIANNNYLKEKNFVINLGIIPLGTGNSIAYSSGILNEFDALKTLFNDSKISKLPIYKVSFPIGKSFDINNNVQINSLYFLVVVSWGVHAGLVHESEKPELKKLGVERFKLAFNNLISNPNLQYQGELYIEEEEEENNNNKTILVPNGNNLYTTILSVPLVEKTYKLSPHSNIKTNQLHLINIPELETRDEFVKIIFLPYQDGAHINNKHVLYKDIGNSIVLKIQQDNAKICVDGKIISIEDSKGEEVKVELIDQDQFNINLIGI
ncbi:hypothetical protein WICMUC_005573 [Wickerhamomyces mucosus]|uniref:DAGKc domain-containing protein n=1 Tax=Wickerhamomyces mucosus TaxID=1378264 RepID=A0A9P8T5R1_9ASCO|nr:hypothetical protein WICMUC_005573 [Wickerhamomyces mucosus]